VFPGVQLPAAAFGAWISNTGVTANSITVWFSQYALAGTTYNSYTGATNWSASIYDAWRVRKTSAGAAVGFGLVVPGTSAGLVSASGLPGNLGSTVGAGYVGQLALNVTNSSVTATYGGANGTVSSGSLTGGVYLISCDVSGVNDVRPASGSGTQQLLLKVNGVTISAYTALSSWYSTATIKESEYFTGNLMGYVVVPAGSTHTVEVILVAVANSGTPTNYTCFSRALGALKAIRIA
jgi:hypothetical protein